MEKELKEKLWKPLKSLIDLKFLIPSLFLILSLVGNGVQCGSDALKRHWLERTRNALNLALAKQKNLKARQAFIEYKATKKVTDPKILANDKKYKELEKQANKSAKELKRIRKKIGGMTLIGVRNGLNKQLGDKVDDKELPLEPEPDKKCPKPVCPEKCPPCPCGNEVR